MVRRYVAAADAALSEKARRRETTLLAATHTAESRTSHRAATSIRADVQTAPARHAVAATPVAELFGKPAQAVARREAAAPDERIRHGGCFL